MSYRVVVLARARLDVDMIYDWIADRSIEGAQRWWEQFEKATATLEANPFMAPLAPNPDPSTSRSGTSSSARGPGAHIVPSSRWWTTRFASSGSEGRGNRRSDPETLRASDGMPWPRSGANRRSIPFGRHLS